MLPCRLSCGRTLLVADPLALVRLRFPDLPDVGGDLTDELLVVASDTTWVGTGTSNSMPSGAEPARGASSRPGARRRCPWDRAIADTDDLQPLLESLGHPFDHVGEERPGEAVKAAAEADVVWSLDPRDAFLREDAHRGMHHLRELTRGPRTVTTLASSTFTSTPSGISTGCFRSCSFCLVPTRASSLPRRHHHTKASTSPPTPFRAASLSVITPRDVEMIATPSPPWTRGAHPGRGTPDARASRSDAGP